MTHKDYVLIAKALQAARDEVRAKESPEDGEDLNDGINYATEFLSQALAGENPRFDSERFMIAAGFPLND